MPCLLYLLAWSMFEGAAVNDTTASSVVLTLFCCCLNSRSCCAILGWRYLPLRVQELHLNFYHLSRYNQMLHPVERSNKMGNKYSDIAWNRHTMKRHVTATHDKVNNFKCDSCGKSIWHLNRNMRGRIFLNVNYASMQQVKVMIWTSM